jgi:hypothetical protein
MPFKKKKKRIGTIPKHHRTPRKAAGAACPMLHSTFFCQARGETRQVPVRLTMPMMMPTEVKMVSFVRLKMPTQKRGRCIW